MNHANSTPLADTWSHYLTTLGSTEILMLILVMVVAIATGVFVSAVWGSLSSIDMYEQGTPSGMGGDTDEADAVLEWSEQGDTFAQVDSTNETNGD